MVVMARGSCGEKWKTAFTAHFSALSIFREWNTFLVIHNYTIIYLCLTQCITNLTEIATNLKLIQNGKNCCSTVDRITRRALFVIFIQANEGDLKFPMSVNSKTLFFVVKLILFFREKVQFNGIPINSFDSLSTWSAFDDEKVINFLWFFYGFTLVHVNFSINIHHDRASNLKMCEY